jgi:hypothetical protein
MSQLVGDSDGKYRVEKIIRLSLLGFKLPLIKVKV